MSQKRVKIGIAGARFAAAFHVASYRRLSGIGAEVVGVYSKSRESRESFAGKNGIDVFSCELVMGGVHNWLEVYCNNHRMRCNINPIDANVLYNPVEKQMAGVYLNEKLGTKQGWSFPAPDENWMSGYPQELQDFVECLVQEREPQSNLALAADTVCALYAAYVSAQDGGRETEIPLVAD